MSWKIANLCADRIFGSAARKQIIMFLADKASDDGSGIWCSKGTIQRHTELGESTVKRTITDFLREGILPNSFWLSFRAIRRARSATPAWRRRRIGNKDKSIGRHLYSKNIALEL
jgi:hypothetical protein